MAESTRFVLEEIALFTKLMCVIAAIPPLKETLLMQGFSSSICMNAVSKRNFTWAMLAILSLVTVPAISNTTLLAGTKVHVGVSVPAAQQVSMEEIQFGDWDRLLKRYVDQDGNVDYASWKQSAVDTRSLDQFLSRPSTANAQTQASGKVKLAF